MKKIFRLLIKVFLGIVCLVVLVLALVFFLTSDLTSLADQFFQAVKKKDIEEAYTFVSEDFKLNTSKSNLEIFLIKNQLNNFKEASWESRSISGGRGTLVGSITTESGRTIPLKLNFIKGEEGWKIYSILKPKSGVKSENTELAIPSEEQQVVLVREATLWFADSVNNKSMEKFHSHISNIWKEQVSVKKLDEVFGPFFNSGIDFRVLKNFSPVFNSKPAIAKNGVMSISGFYPTKPKQFHFIQKFVYEGLGWKLLGFSVKVR